MDLKRSLRDILDLEGESPSLKLLPSVSTQMANPIFKIATRAKALAILNGLKDELSSATWFTPEWLDRVLLQLERQFDVSCDRWRTMYRSARNQQEVQNKIILDHTRSPKDQEKAKRLRRESEAQLKLLCESDNLMQSDFYTSDTTKMFFAELMKANKLRRFLGFDNEDKTIFPEIDNNLTFAGVIVGPNDGRKPEFCFNIRKLEEMAERDRFFELTDDDLTLFNPNTRTCPIFRSSIDAMLTRCVYRRFPLLMREVPYNHNPWGLSFLRMLDMANDSGLFQSRAQLEDSGAKQEENCYIKGDARFVPLYEAKMIWHFEHRWASDFGRVITDGRPSRKYVGWYGVNYSDPSDLANGRYWVDAREVCKRSGNDSQYFIAYRSITNRDLERTSVFAVVPAYGIGHKAPVIKLVGRTPAEVGCFVADRNSLICDFVARNKQSGSDLTYFVLKQLPILPPESFGNRYPWSESGQTLLYWVLPRVIELTYTAWDLRPFATDCGWSGPPFRWDEERRFLLRCELDAAFFHLYLPAESNGDWRPAENETAEDRARLKASLPTPRDAVTYIMETGSGSGVCGVEIVSHIFEESPEARVLILTERQSLQEQWRRRFNEAGIQARSLEGTRQNLREICWNDQSSELAWPKSTIVTMFNAPFSLSSENSSKILFCSVFNTSCTDFSIDRVIPAASAGSRQRIRGLFSPIRLASARASSEFSPSPICRRSTVSRSPSFLIRRSTRSVKWPLSGSKYCFRFPTMFRSISAILS